jgi:hypothetical protein
VFLEKCPRDLSAGYLLGSRAGLEVVTKTKITLPAENPTSDIIIVLTEIPLFEHFKTTAFFFVKAIIAQYVHVYSNNPTGWTIKEM